MARTTPRGVFVLLTDGGLLVVGGLAVLAWQALLAAPAGPRRPG